MQWVNDKTPRLRQNMTNAGIPSFGIGTSVNFAGNVNINGTIYGQQVFNTANIDRSGPSVQATYKELAQVRKDYGRAWMKASYGDNWLATLMQMGIDPASNLATVGAGFKYTSSNFLREGYWQGVNGKYYSLSLAQEGSKGWVIYKGSAEIAKNSVRSLNMIGQGLGYLSLGYSAYNFATTQSWKNGIDLGISITSVALWEIGSVYYFGSGMVNASSGERSQIQNNIMNGRDPLYNVYNPSLGY